MLFPTSFWLTQSVRIKHVKILCISCKSKCQFIAFFSTSIHLHTYGNECNSVYLISTEAAVRLNQKYHFPKFFFPAFDPRIQCVLVTKYKMEFTCSPHESSTIILIFLFGCVCYELCALGGGNCDSSGNKKLFFIHLKSICACFHLVSKWKIYWKSLHCSVESLENHISCLHLS